MDLSYRRGVWSAADGRIALSLTEDTGLKGGESRPLGEGSTVFGFKSKARLKSARAPSASPLAS